MAKKRYVLKKERKGARLGLWAVLLAVVVLATVLIVVLSRDDGERVPAEGDGLWDGSWYEDDLGRIQRERPLVKGMKAFEKQTGVRPYLTILADVAPEELAAFAQDQYEALFSGGDHLLVVYDEWEEGTYYLAARTGTGSALSDPDASLLLSCIEKAYADPAYDTYAAAFGAGFAQCAQQMADRSDGSGSVALLLWLGCLLAALALVLILFLRKKYRVSDA